MPAFLANDILRMWRTFCVNYEARTQTAPPDRKAKRKLKNYKLKHSRLLTCYSALLYLLTMHLMNRTVSPTDAVSMISLSLTARLEWMLTRPELSGAHRGIAELISRYEEFLGNTDMSESELVQRFMDKEESKRYTTSAYEFGDLVHKVLEAVGKQSRFYRLLVV
jgi:hypothetical protein